ncbi:MAG TPA: sigma-54-dependent Fis family transcriptional regulator [Rhodospirillaceae bacterium]|nr:sigma-54-dependent Fis family transcriptional regulator [Rhodospirillaceae bacterium]
MSQPVLIVEDDPLQRQMLATLLRRKLDFGSLEAENGRKALEILATDLASAVRLIILDLDMPIMGGMETLEILRQKHPSIPVIMLTGNKDIEPAVQAMKLGAVDFLTKPYEGERMMVTVRNALRLSILSKEVSRLKSEKEGTFTFENLIGHDGGLLPVVNIGRKAAASDIPVLIGGETGTGKEVFARAIHGESARAGKPFIAVNCGALPSQLVESILFGHEKGAFTGATEKAIGKFREAEGGTIFLDEIGELPLDSQVKLLRVLQQKEVEPVGANKPVPVNIRIISATNRDLQKEVTGGKFREDLFFRLNVLQIILPPLRERREDIPELSRHFIERFCIDTGAIPKTVSRALEEKLIRFEWPGNVRQLENAMSRAMVVSESNVLDVDDFSALLLGATAGQKETSSDGTGKPQHIRVISPDGHFKTAEEIEREAMDIALEHFQGNITQAAKALGMAKSTFYKKNSDRT